MSDENKDRSEDEVLQPASAVLPGGVEVRVESGDLGGGQIDPVDIPSELPILPLKNTVLFPFLLSPLLVNTPASQELIDDVLLRPEYANASACRLGRSDRF